jgi:hypothetical protein
VLVFGLGPPEGAGLADRGHDRARPHARGIGVGDRVLGDLALLVARIEDLGAVVGADDDRLGMTRMILGGRVVVLPVGLIFTKADAGLPSMSSTTSRYARTTTTRSASARTT